MGVDASIRTPGQHIQHEIDLARAWASLVQTPRNQTGFEGYVYAGWGDALRSNRWNGLYSQAYFGWWHPEAQDFPESWKAYRTGRDGEPVLEHLEKIHWPLRGER